MSVQIATIERRTSADVVFEYLRNEIVSNTLPPGSRLSEVDIAKRFGVSRQPVRDAFSRLANQDLLLIRPQKPTIVRKFSLSKITQARFVRLSVELEVVTRACEIWDDSKAEQIGDNLVLQRRTIDRNDSAGFHALDYDFHKLICEQSGYGIMFETIQYYKAKIDRLCMLSLSDATEGSELLEDHEELAHALVRRDIQGATTVIRRHLSRLDKTVQTIHAENTNYFEE